MTWSTPGVFNVLDPWAGGTSGMVAGAGVSYAQAVANAEVLQAAIWAAQIATSTSCGSLPVAGEVVIPGHSIIPPPVNPGGTGDVGALYLLAVPPVNAAFNAAIVINCNWPVLIRGTGNVKLEMYTDAEHTNLGDMFYLQTTQGDNTGGVTFEDLVLTYPEISDQSLTTYWSAIHTATVTLGGSDGGARNVRLNRVVLEDCPIACWFEQALQPSLLNCTIIWNFNFGIGVMLGDGGNGKASAKEIYIAGCIFDASTANVPGQTAIQVGACDHLRVENCQIDSVTYGIIITPGAGPGSTAPPTETPVNAVHLSFTGVNVYCSDDASSNQGKACVIQPATSNQAVAQVVFQGCTFELADTANPSVGGPGILVSANDDTTVDSIRFVSCYSCQWAGPGLMIEGSATNIEVVGGVYAGNKYQEVASQPYGIYVGDTTGGTVVGVRIAGASCVGTYKVVTLKKVTSSGTQAVGIYIDEGASDVTIVGCDIRKNSEYGIYVNGDAANVIIDSCNITSNGMNGIYINGSTAALSDILIRNCDVSGYGAYGTAINVVYTLVANVSTVYITNCTGYNDWSPELFAGAHRRLSSITIATDTSVPLASTLGLRLGIQ